MPEIGGAERIKGKKLPIKHHTYDHWDRDAHSLFEPCFNLGAITGVHFRSVIMEKNMRSSNSLVGTIRDLPGSPPDKEENHGGSSAFCRLGVGRSGATPCETGDG